MTRLVRPLVTILKELISYGAVVSDKDKDKGKRKTSGVGSARRRSISNDSTRSSGGSVSSRDPPPSSTTKEEMSVQVLRAAPVNRSKANKVNARQLLSAMWRFAAMAQRVLWLWLRRALALASASSPDHAAC